MKNLAKFKIVNDIENEEVIVTFISPWMENICKNASNNQVATVNFGNERIKLYQLTRSGSDEFKLLSLIAQYNDLNFGSAQYNFSPKNLTWFRIQGMTTNYITLTFRGLALEDELQEFEQNINLFLAVTYRYFTFEGKITARGKALLRGENV